MMRPTCLSAFLEYKCHLMLLFLGTVLCPVEGTKVTCEVQPVKLMAETNLTCYFPEDINQTKNDFSIYHYKKGSSDSVLDCLWISGKIKCFVQPGYEFNNEVSDHISVRIPQVSEKHTGRYRCQMHGNRPEHFHRCNFHLLRDEGATCEVQAARRMSDTHLRCYFHKDFSQTWKSFEVRHHQGETQNTVTKCEWIRGTKHCVTHAGYKLNEVVKNLFTVWLPQPSSQHTGNYTCHISDTKSEDSRHCLFNVSQEDIPYTGRGKSSKAVEYKVFIMTFIIQCLLFLRRTAALEIYCFSRSV